MKLIFRKRLLECHSNFDGGLRREGLLKNTFPYRWEPSLTAHIAANRRQLTILEEAERCNFQH